MRNLHDVTTGIQDGDECLTVGVAQAARLLGVSRDLVYDLVKRGAVPSVRLGGRLLIARRVIAEIVDGERVPLA